MSQVGRSGALTGFLEVARAAGIDAYQLASAVGIPAAALTDPELSVSSRAMSELIEVAAERSGLADFGLRMAEKRRLANMGALGLALRDQPTLRKALEMLHQYAWLQNDALSVGLEEVDDLALLRIGMPSWRGRQATELVVGIIFRMITAVCGPGWRPLEIRINHTAPANLQTYRRLFGMTPLFEQDFLGFVMARGDLDRPLAAYDPDMAKVASRYIAHLAEGRGPALADKVQEIILALLPSSGCTVDRVALRMGIDRRTLHRRLSAEDTTFTQLLNMVRRELAISLLSTTQRPLHGIAEILGFASLSAFAHWFRRNFDCAPGTYRARRGGSSDHAATFAGASSGSRIT